MRAIFGLLLISAGLWILWYLYQHGPFAPAPQASDSFTGTKKQGGGA